MGARRRFDPNPGGTRLAQRLFLARSYGRPAAVLGGGLSLPDDIAKLPEGTVLIDCNGRGSTVVDCDYVMYCDMKMANKVKGLPGLKVSPGVRGTYKGTGIMIPREMTWSSGFTGHTAAWFALYLGCKPVLLCGMDLYTGDREYHFDENPRPPGDMDTLRRGGKVRLMQQWAAAKNHLERWQDIRAVSGPLVELFGQYEGGDPC